MSEFDKFITITDAKKDLLNLVKEIQEHDESVAITRNGYPAVVLMSMKDYEGLMETVEILSDPQAIKLIKKSLKEFQSGKVVEGDEVWGD